MFVPFLAKIAGYERSREGHWVVGAATGIGVAGMGANALLSALGFSAVAHSSGAAILTGAGGYIAGTYGIASIIAFLSAPVILMTFVVCSTYGLFVLVKRKLRRKK
ncbi:hypothetical protein [Paracoccus luteus]|uniref:hypothetical protein n=1 Tax=Paracoccus luteus TaxID=2508543 RepID=UPI00106FAAD9|nr:hypothetical protein [Paracoccus luteus]